jgi:molecular chaperone GrpE
MDYMEDNNIHRAVTKESVSEHSQKEKKKKDKKEEKIKELTKLLEEKASEADENYQRFLRTCAELENFKKRAEREKSEAIKFSNEGLLKELITVLDNLERAIHHADETHNTESLREGVKLTMDELLKTLQKFGLEQVSAVGDKFDPNKHEAIAVIESSEHEEGTVIGEFQKAYFLKERLLRPARVTVSKPHNQEKKSTTEEGE